MFSILFLSKATKPPIDLYNECESFDVQSFWDDVDRVAKQATEPAAKQATEPAAKSAIDTAAKQANHGIKTNFVFLI